MVIGRLEPGMAKQTDLKKAIAIGLDEALTALEESVFGLTDEQARAFPLPGRNNIVGIVMHLQQNLDCYACRFQAGAWTLEHDERFDLWGRPEGAPPPSEDLPTVAEMLGRLHAIRSAAEAALGPATEAELLGSRCCEHHWLEQGRTAADAYLRTIMHAMAHVRQIWLLRGALGLTDRDGWPEQHWA